MGDSLRVIDISQLPLRHIEMAEYSALPKRSRSKAAAVLNVRGALALLLAAFAAGLIVDAVSTLIKGGDDVWLKLFIGCMVGLFLALMAVMVVYNLLVWVVPDDALVSPGEVIGIDDVRTGKSGSFSSAVYTVRLASGDHVSLRDYEYIDTGAAVLIIRSKSMQYHLYRLPAEVIDMSPLSADLYDELGGVTDIDISRLQKVSITAVEKHTLSDSEYMELPSRIRSISLLGHGAASVAWVIFTVITAAMLTYAVKSYKSADSEVFVPFMGGFICELFIEIFLTGIVTKVILPKNTARFIDCIAVNSTSGMGAHFISIVIPDKEQYVEQVKVDEEVCGSVPLNVPIRIYVAMMFCDVKCVVRR